MNGLLPDKAPLIARCSSGKDSLHGAEKKALLLVKLYGGPNNFWAPFVTIIVQLMYSLVLCCVVALLACISPKNIFCPTKIYILNYRHRDIATIATETHIVFCWVSVFDIMLMPDSKAKKFSSYGGAFVFLLSVRVHMDIHVSGHWCVSFYT